MVHCAFGRDSVVHCCSGKKNVVHCGTGRDTVLLLKKIWGMRLPSAGDIGGASVKPGTPHSLTVNPVSSPSHTQLTPLITKL